MSRTIPRNATRQLAPYRERFTQCIRYDQENQYHGAPCDPAHAWSKLDRARVTVDGDVLIISVHDNLWYELREPKPTPPEPLSDDDSEVQADAAEQRAAFTHTGLAAHDGYAEHSHEIRPDHRGVGPLTEPSATAAPQPAWVSSFRPDTDAAHLLLDCYQPAPDPRPFTVRVSRAELETMLGTPLVRKCKHCQEVIYPSGPLPDWASAERADHPALFCPGRAGNDFPVHEPWPVPAP